MLSADYSVVGVTKSNNMLFNCNYQAALQGGCQVVFLSKWYHGITRLNFSEMIKTENMLHNQG